MSDLKDFLRTAPVDEVIALFDAALEHDRKMGRTICSQCHGMRIERWSTLIPIDQPMPLVPTREERPCRKCNGSRYNPMNTRNSDYPPSAIWDACEHVWRDAESMADGEVICTRCGCPGSRDGDEVYWPAT